MEKETALNRSVGKVEIVEDSEFTSGIYLPMIYSADSSIAVGKSIEISFGGEPVSYTICGFFNSVMTGSHNCGMTSLVFTEDQYEELKEKGLAFHSTLVSVRIADKEESEDFETMLKTAVSSAYPAVLTLSNSYAICHTFTGSGTACECQCHQSFDCGIPTWDWNCKVYVYHSDGFYHCSGGWNYRIYLCNCLSVVFENQEN
jgi:hypothetical protein